LVPLVHLEELDRQDQLVPPDQEERMVLPEEVLLELLVLLVKMARRVETD